MKMIYQEPKIIIGMLDEEDVIRTSVGSDDWGSGGETDLTGTDPTKY